MSIKINPRKGETKQQARERVRTNLLGCLSLLEKGMGPLNSDSEEAEELQKAYDVIDSIFNEEFE
jgi:hypothetical protein